MTSNFYLKAQWLLTLIVPHLTSSPNWPCCRQMTSLSSIIEAMQSHIKYNKFLRCLDDKNFPRRHIKKFFSTSYRKFPPQQSFKKFLLIHHFHHFHHFHLVVTFETLSSPSHFSALAMFSPPLSFDWVSQFLQPIKPFFYLRISFFSCSISDVLHYFVKFFFYNVQNLPLLQHIFVRPLYIFMTFNV